MTEIKVVAGAIVRADHVLIVKRPANSKFQAEKWEFPGGKVELGESDEQALVRELKEELDIDVTVGNCISTSSGIQADGKKLQMKTYLCELMTEKVIPNGCWVTSDSIDEYEFPDLDKPVVQAIKALLPNNPRQHLQR